MVPFDMPLDAKLALAKMSVIYEREVGGKIKMSRDEDIVSLINFAVDSFNEEIIRYLDTFTKLLGPSELQQLVAQGANIYRGAVVPKVDPFTPDSYPKEGTLKRTYRGVAVPGDEMQQSPDSGGDTSLQKKTGKRIYRGRVIED